MDIIDATALIEAAALEPVDRRGLSQLARSLETSEILTIAYDVRGRIESGADILNLTVGDFSPAEYPLLPELRDSVIEALRAGHSNYPPAPGVLELRQAVRNLYERRLRLRYGVDSVLVASGARPLIAGSYLCLVDPGEAVVFPTPSWNNDHYTSLTHTQRIELPTSPETNFFPSISDLEAVLPRARLIVLNTPQNPTGTVMGADDLKRAAEVVVEENERRKKAGQRAVYILFDQIYWMLTFEGAEHKTPVQLVPESAPYVIHVDGISKGFAATGLRVGYAVGPTDVLNKMTSVLAHLGCWAPRAEQVGAAKVLEDEALFERHVAHICREAGDRLRTLKGAVEAVAAEGYPVKAIAPEGAIYLSLHFDLRHKKQPNGRRLETDEDMRIYLLDEAGLALVPFRAFGARDGSGWFRASVGVASRADCASVKDRLLRALARLG